ncbi:MAG: MBL fold metallo-hydrolase, partial [Saprospiraceae bacterium]|nr:MBL fold metallo-hydrolase [Saprospiraceae bacterium]
MKIQFCGAAQEVTGSAHLITLDDGYKILLDCGLYQGGDDDMSQFNSEWLFDPSDINVLVLSHAHIDHCGRIPKLVKDGFKGNIYCTYATRDLSGILLMDSAQIQERDAEYINKVYKKKGQSNRKKKEPLYTLPDVTFAMQQFVSIGYERWFKIHDNVEVLFRDAGHILGSASVTLKIKEKGRQIMFGFTGDIGRPNRPILKDPIRMPRLDYVISESTYGDRVHLATPGEEEKFLKTLQHTCVDKRGKLIIPAFSVGRTQEVVYLMNKLYNEKKLPKIPVFVDSPLAVSATEIFLSHPECFDDELNNYMQKDDNPFGFKELQYIRKVEASKALNQINGPCIIISASGMANA